MKFHARIAVITVAIFIVALTTDSSAKPAEEEEERQLIPTPLSTILGPLLGLFAGLALARALGGIGGGNRRRSYGGWGRRCGRDLDGQDDPLDKIEDDLMFDILDVMKQTETEECYERMLCDIASKDEGLNDFSDLLNFVSGDEDLFVPAEYKDFRNKLRAASQFGENVEDNQVCEETYGCPLSGEEMSTMMKEEFEEDMPEN